MTDVQILRGETMKVGDTEPSLRLQVLNALGNPYDLRDYTPTIRIRSTTDSDLTVDTTITVESGKRGIVSYDWSVGDTDTTGVYLVEVEAEHDTSGDTITFPSDGYERVYIEEKL